MPSIIRPWHAVPARDANYHAERHSGHRSERQFRDDDHGGRSGKENLHPLSVAGLSTQLLLTPPRPNSDGAPTSVSTLTKRPPT
jgi:hypothetical protein